MILHLPCPGLRPVGLLGATKFYAVIVWRKPLFRIANFGFHVFTHTL